MNKLRLYAAGAGILLAAGVGAETMHYRSTMQTQVGIIDPFKTALRPASIRKDWVLEGDNQTFAKLIAHTDDGSADVYVWQTGKGKFHWNYDQDEIVSVIDGEVFITDETTHVERRLGAGDVAFFPQGARTTWRVPDHIRKVATLKHMLPGPLAATVRWLRYAKNWVKPSSAFAAD